MVAHKKYTRKDVDEIQEQLYTFLVKFGSGPISLDDFFVGVKESLNYNMEKIAPEIGYKNVIEMIENFPDIDLHIVEKELVVYAAPLDETMKNLFSTNAKQRATSKWVSQISNSLGCTYFKNSLTKKTTWFKSVELRLLELEKKINLMTEEKFNIIQEQLCQSLKSVNSMPIAISDYIELVKHDHKYDLPSIELFCGTGVVVKFLRKFPSIYIYQIKNEYFITTNPINQLEQNLQHLRLNFESSAFRSHSKLESSPSKKINSSESVQHQEDNSQEQFRTPSVSDFQYIGVICSRTTFGPEGFLVYCPEFLLDLCLPNQLIKKDHQLKLGQWIRFNFMYANGRPTIVEFTKIDSVYIAMEKIIEERNMRIKQNTIRMSVELTIPKDYHADKYAGKLKANVSKFECAVKEIEVYAADLKIGKKYLGKVYIATIMKSTEPIRGTDVLWLVENLQQPIGPFSRHSF